MGKIKQVLLGCFSAAAVVLGLAATAVPAMAAPAAHTEAARQCQWVIGSHRQGTTWFEGSFAKNTCGQGVVLRGFVHCQDGRDLRIYLGGWVHPAGKWSKATCQVGTRKGGGVDVSTDGKRTYHRYWITGDLPATPVPAVHQMATHGSRMALMSAHHARARHGCSLAYTVSAVNTRLVDLRFTQTCGISYRAWRRWGGSDTDLGTYRKTGCPTDCNDPKHSVACDITSCQGHPDGVPSCYGWQRKDTGATHTIGGCAAPKPAVLTAHRSSGQYLDDDQTTWTAASAIPGRTPYAAEPVVAAGANAWKLCVSAAPYNPGSVYLCSASQWHLTNDNGTPEWDRLGTGGDQGLTFPAFGSGFRVKFSTSHYLCQAASKGGHDTITKATGCPDARQTFIWGSQPPARAHLARTGYIDIHNSSCLKEQVHAWQTLNGAKTGAEWRDGYNGCLWWIRLHVHCGVPSRNLDYGWHYSGWIVSYPPTDTVWTCAKGFAFVVYLQWKHHASNTIYHRRLVPASAARERAI